MATFYFLRKKLKNVDYLMVTSQLVNLLTFQLLTKENGYTSIYNRGQRG